jgi:hypothetical protein
MKLLSIKTFEDRYNNNKKFHHVNLLGLKFRIANNKRSSTKETRKIYRTDRGLVLNVLPNRYICLIK